MASSIVTRKVDYNADSAVMLSSIMSAIAEEIGGTVKDGIAVVSADSNMGFGLKQYGSSTSTVYTLYCTNGYVPLNNCPTTYTININADVNIDILKHGTTIAIGMRNSLSAQIALALVYAETTNDDKFIFSLFNSNTVYSAIDGAATTTYINTASNVNSQNVITLQKLTPIIRDGSFKDLYVLVSHPSITSSSVLSANGKHYQILSGNPATTSAIKLAMLID